MGNKELIDEIKRLKDEKNAVILVHNYQRPEIYEVGDFIGDSFALAKAAKETNAEIIVFCGVDFMAESAKILNPNKKVLLPALSAKCPMAAMVTPEGIKELKEKNENAAVVCYVNTSADVKAVSDVCCTSRNAVKIVESLDAEKVIMVPDYHLGNYVKSKVNKEIILWDGYCYVHSAVIPSIVEKAKKNHPEAVVLVHPECPMNVINLADFVCSTEGMVKVAKENDANEFIIVTEEGMVERLKIECPEKKFYPGAGVCFNQKFITLDLVRDALREGKHVIEISEEIRVNAEKALNRMIEICK